MKKYIIMLTESGYKSTIKLFPVIILFALMLVSCEEVINIDLNSSNPKLVIEGTISDKPGPYTVMITKTTDYFIPADYPKVSGAEVIITDDNGVVDHLIETQPGLYQTDSIAGIPGHTYTLSVKLNGQIYSARSTMPLPVEIDSITYKKTEISRRGKKIDNQFQVYCNFQDKAGCENFSRLKVYNNGEEIDRVFLFSDRLFDGDYIKYSQFHSDFNLNEKIKIELWSIDKSVYKYFSTLKDAIAIDGGGNPMSLGATPANPASNISGGALGYFGAFSIRADSVVIR